MEVWSGVYDGLSALLSERMGYDGLWLGSLSAAVGMLGVPDDGRIGADRMAQLASEITSITATPVCVDIENGYGLQGDHIDRCAEKLYSSGARGVCIQDALGPQQNSFLSTHRGLTDVAVFEETLSRWAKCASVVGGKVYARTEALIEGLSEDEAYRRVERYLDAGADGVVVHFRKDPEAVLRVARRSPLAHKLIVIPTAAPDVHFAEFASAGFGICVVANVALRTAYRAIDLALQETLSEGRLSEALRNGGSIEDLHQLVSR
ncbi:isocitrate lyase/PEP mutase family protein [Actinopolymorpha sp. B17G11]|uniref:isocitrate lyase/PEP mutase family protein n=1 Tax=Actinopolymorpha sp. B17G11 TaxID=3160861 RepID=UPI0032E3E584